MDTSFMKEYIALAENLNFTIASEQLFLVQSTLSRHLMMIEKELGTTLFTRTTHKVELTEDGQRVLRDFKRIVSTYDTLVDGFSKKSEGHIRFGILYYAIDKYLAPILQHFKNEYPAIEISVSSNQPLQIIDELLSDKIDVGFLESGDYSAKHLLRFQTIAKEKLVLMICSTHAFAERAEVAIRELEGQTLVLMKDHNWMNARIAQLLGDTEVKPSDIRYADHIDTLAMTLQETNGIAIVSEHLKSMQRNNIRIIDLPDETMTIDICLAYRKDNPNPNIKKFISSAKAAL